MNKRDRVASQSRIKVRNADEEPKRWRTYLLMGVCLTLLVSGFFFAGRQHFSSMDYGMKNSKLRNEIIKLEAEKLRLVYTREVALSPGEIRKAARKAGIIGTPDWAAVPQITSMTREKAAPAAPNASSDSRSLIIKTAVVSPAKPDVQTAVLKTPKSTGAVKKAIAAE